MWFYKPLFNLRMLSSTFRDDTGKVENRLYDLLCFLFLTLCVLPEVLPVNRAFQKGKSGKSTRSFFFVLAKEGRQMANSHGARLQKQLQTAIILSVTFI
jgi:hypothetical protein